MVSKTLDIRWQKAVIPESQEAGWALQWSQLARCREVGRSDAGWGSWGRAREPSAAGVGFQSGLPERRHLRGCVPVGLWAPRLRSANPLRPPQEPTHPWSRHRGSCTKLHPVVNDNHKRLHNDSYHVAHEHDFLRTKVTHISLSQWKGFINLHFEEKKKSTFFCQEKHHSVKLGS